MSNPYSNVTITGYNSSPPPDDGTQIATNQLKWSNTIDKVGGPLKTAIESINTNTLNAFASVFGSTVTVKSADYTVLTSDQGALLVMDTAAQTFTLPAAADAGDNFVLAFANRSGGLMTIDGNSSETINGSTTLILPDNYDAILFCNGSLWYAMVTGYKVRGSFTPTFSGFSSSPSGTTIYRLDGGTVTMRMGFNVGTSNSADFSVTNVPAVIRPQNAQIIPCPMLEDNGSQVTGQGHCIVNSDGTIDFAAPGNDPTVGGGFTASGNKGLQNSNSSIQYSIWPLD